MIVQKGDRCKKKNSKGSSGLSIIEDKNRLRIICQGWFGGSQSSLGVGKDCTVFLNLSKHNFLLYSDHKH